MQISKLEQTGALRVLIFLKKEGNQKIGEIVDKNKRKISQAAIYRSITNLLELGLVKEEILENPPRRIISLTSKGERIAELLTQIGEILEGE
nr:winged helix-turn-helix transcriptional regulator [Candidatus Freyarchaeota archaeon]